MGIACSLMLTVSAGYGTRCSSGWSWACRSLRRFLVSTSMAMVMPIVLKRMGVDPAVAAGPFVTTANDITGTPFTLHWRRFSPSSFANDAMPTLSVPSMSRRRVVRCRW